MEKKTLSKQAPSNQQKKVYAKPAVQRVKTQRGLSTRMSSCSCSTEPKPNDTACW